MRESLNEPISVVFYYDAAKRHLKPHLINWHGRDYKLGPVDFHHKTRKGANVIHHFSMSDIDRTAYFKIALDTGSLHWALEEYMYGDETAVHYAHPEA